MVRPNVGSNVFVQACGLCFRGQCDDQSCGSRHGQGNRTKPRLAQGCSSSSQATRVWDNSQRSGQCFFIFGCHYNERKKVSWVLHHGLEDSTVSGNLSFRHLCTTSYDFRFPPLMYTANGKATIKRLWQGTLDEFDFADMRGVLESMKK